MYYSVFDTDTRNYTETGLNSKTEAECVADILEFVLSDSEFTDKDIDVIKNIWSLAEQKEYLKNMGYEIQEHSQRN
jgi:hypothetical protein